MRELLVATNNKGKIDEIRTLLTDAPFTLLSLADVGISFDVEETATTFEGNSIIKAMTYGAMSGKLTLSEDSGLAIDALGGGPGVYTKRYAEGTSDNGHAKFFEEMKDVPDEMRSAQFISVITLYDPGTHRVHLCEGVAHGKITREARGTNGFGQDPIFLYDGTTKTGGEMTMEEKNAVSHRAKSLAKAKEMLLKEFV
jgi:XTP/dITP diphosphohydrolase